MDELVARHSEVRGPPGLAARGLQDAPPVVRPQVRLENAEGLGGGDGSTLRYRRGELGEGGFDGGHAENWHTSRLGEFSVAGLGREMSCG